MPGAAGMEIGDGTEQAARTRALHTNYAGRTRVLVDIKYIVSVHVLSYRRARGEDWGDAAAALARFAATSLGRTLNSVFCKPKSYIIHITQRAHIH